MTQRSVWAHKDYFQYKADIRMFLPGYELPSVVSIEFHIGLPKSYSEKKKQSLYGQYHQKKPDVDNFIKGFLDAFGSDDAHVAVVHAGKYWCEENETPCIVLDYSPALPK